MSETNALAPEGYTAEPVVKSETGAPVEPDNGELPAPEPEPEAKPETPKAEEKVNGKPWWEDRIAKQSRKIADSERRADSLARENEQLRAAAKPQEDKPASQQTSQADIDRLVEQRATQQREAERQNQSVREFNAECDKVFEAGKTQFPDDFAKVLPTIWQATDAVGSDGQLKPIAIALIEAAIETGKAHEVLYHLGKNPEEAVRIAGLSSETKRAAAIVKLAGSLDAPKQVSKAPAPITPVGGSAKSEGDDLLNIKDTATFIKKFEERQAARKGGR